ncbi:FHA domain-containing protein [Lyngbya confervoides]|uniref:FHA domain-containing protein n=1 Tax=Lyngbya confervoides BDU141951 TaxID=1574623 RepID=A0ABD4T0Y4_9CYAN|nr:FHA domain-containing protein [Lyngbya confervoides]MCM1982306.1 FHA domain-containing protein [Lyngbya confervoides BDU141951]
MKAAEQEFHFLIMHENNGYRPIHLVSPTYSLGRSSKNSIVLPSPSISRHHALLLRMPSTTQGKYQYRLLDGDASGKLSMNGLTVNGQKCSMRDLISGDRIVFGGIFEVTYQVTVSAGLQQSGKVHPAAYAEDLSEEDMYTMLTANLDLKQAQKLRSRTPVNAENL